MASRPLVRVFISYRRADSAEAAVHLQATLAQRFGAEAVFRDQTGLRPGQDFPRELEQAIQRSTAVIALIGRRWAGLADKSGRTRLDEPRDFVRRELETALAHSKSILPVLMDGATMPKASDLPKSLKAMARLQAVVLPWHETTAELGNQISAKARELASEVRVSVAAAKADHAPNSRQAALMAMQASLARQGRKGIKLDARDLDASLRRLSDLGHTRLVFFPDLVYVLDLIGVKAHGSDQRYVARSKALKSLDDIVTHLQRDQTVLAAVTRTMAWFREPALSSGFIDHDPRPQLAGGLVGVISGWHVGRREFTVHTLDARFGRAGVLTLTWKAARQLIDTKELRAIDAAPLPLPYSARAIRDLKSRLPRRTRATASPPATPRRRSG